MLWILRRLINDIFTKIVIFQWGLLKAPQIMFFKKSLVIQGKWMIFRLSIRTHLPIYQANYLVGPIKRDFTPTLTPTWFGNTYSEYTETISLKRSIILAKNKKKHLRYQANLPHHILLLLQTRDKQIQFPFLITIRDTKNSLMNVESKV